MSMHFTDTDLLWHGYAEGDLRKISHENFSRVIGAVLGALTLLSSLHPS